MKGFSPYKKISGERKQELGRNLELALLKEELPQIFATVDGSDLDVEGFGRVFSNIPDGVTYLTNNKDRPGRYVGRDFTVSEAEPEDEGSVIWDEGDCNTYIDGIIPSGFKVTFKEGVFR